MKDMFNLNFEVMEVRAAAAGIEMDSLYLPVGDKSLRNAAKELSLRDRFSGSTHFKPRVYMGRPLNIDEKIEKFLDDSDTMNNLLDKYDMAEILGFISYQQSELNKVRPQVEIEKTRVQLAVMTIHLMRRVFIEVLPNIQSQHMSHLGAEKLNLIQEAKAAANKSLVHLMP